MPRQDKPSGNRDRDDQHRSRTKKKEGSPESDGSQSSAERRAEYRRMHPTVRERSASRERLHPRPPITKTYSGFASSTSHKDMRHQRSAGHFLGHGPSYENLRRQPIATEHSIRRRSKSQHQSTSRAGSRQRSPSASRPEGASSSSASRQRQMEEMYPARRESTAPKPPKATTPERVPDRYVFQPDGRAPMITIANTDTPGTAISLRAQNEMSRIFNDQKDILAKVRVKIQTLRAEQIVHPTPERAHRIEAMVAHAQGIEDVLPHLQVRPTGATASPLPAPSTSTATATVPKASVVPDNVAFVLQYSDESTDLDESNDRMETDGQNDETTGSDDPAAILRRRKALVAKLPDEKRDELGHIAVNRATPVLAERAHATAERNRLQLVMDSNANEPPSSEIRGRRSSDVSERIEARCREVAAFIVNMLNGSIPFMPWHLFAYKFADVFTRQFEYHPGASALAHIGAWIKTLGDAAPQTWDDQLWNSRVQRFAEETPGELFGLACVTFQHTTAITTPCVIESAADLRVEYGFSEWKALLSTPEFAPVGDPIARIFGACEMHNIIADDLLKDHRGPVPRILVMVNSKGSYLIVDFLALGGMPKAIADFIQDPQYAKLVAGNVSEILPALAVVMGIFGRHRASALAVQWGIQDVKLERRQMAGDTPDYRPGRGYSIPDLERDAQSCPTSWEAIFFMATGHLPIGPSESSVETVMTTFGFEYGPAIETEQQQRRSSLFWLLDVPVPTNDQFYEQKILRYLLLDGLAPLLMHLTTAILFPHLHRPSYVPDHVIEGSRKWIERLEEGLHRLLPISTYDRIAAIGNPFECNPIGTFVVATGLRGCDCLNPRCSTAQLDDDFDRDSKIITDQDLIIHRMGINPNYFPCGVADKASDRTDPFPIFPFLKDYDVPPFIPFALPVKVVGFDPDNFGMFDTPPKAQRRQRESSIDRQLLNTGIHAYIEYRQQGPAASLEKAMQDIKRTPRIPTDFDPDRRQQPLVDVKSHPSFRELCRDYQPEFVERAYDHLYDKDFGMIRVRYPPFAPEWIRPVNQDPVLAMVERILSIFKDGFDPVDGEWFHPEFIIPYPNSMDDIQQWTAPVFWPRNVNHLPDLPPTMAYEDVAEFAKAIAGQLRKKARQMRGAVYTPEAWSQARINWLNEYLAFIRNPATHITDPNSPCLSWDHHRWYSYLIFVVKGIMIRSGEPSAIMVRVRRTINQLEAVAFEHLPGNPYRPIDQLRTALQLGREHLREFRHAGDSVALALLIKCLEKIRTKAGRHGAFWPRAFYDSEAEDDLNDQGHQARHARHQPRSTSHREQQPERSSQPRDNRRSPPRASSSRRDQSGHRDDRSSQHRSSRPHQGGASWNPEDDDHRPAPPPRESVALRSFIAPLLQEPRQPTVNPKAHIPADGYVFQLAKRDDYVFPEDQQAIALEVAVEITIDWLLPHIVIAIPSVGLMSLAGARLLARLAMLRLYNRPACVTSRHPLNDVSYKSLRTFLLALKALGESGTRWGLITDPAGIDQQRSVELAQLRRTEAFHLAGEPTRTPYQSDGLLRQSSPYLQLAGYRRHHPVPPPLQPLPPPPPAPVQLPQPQPQQQATSSPRDDLRSRFRKRRSPSTDPVSGSKSQRDTTGQRAPPPKEDDDDHSDHEAPQAKRTEDEKRRLKAKLDKQMDRHQRRHAIDRTSSALAGVDNRTLGEQFEEFKQAETIEREALAEHSSADSDDSEGHEDEPMDFNPSK